MKRNYDSLTRLLQQTRQVAEMAKRCTPSHPFLFFSTFPLYFILLTVMNNRSIHAQQDGLVELAIQSSLAGFEPNTTVEISSAQVTAVHLPSTRPSFCSVYKSGEDVTTTLVSSEVDERQSIGRLAASLRVQKREASAAAARIYHSTGEKFNVKLSSHSKRGETCCDTLTQTEIEQRPKTCTGEKFRK